MGVVVEGRPPVSVNIYCKGRVYCLKCMTYFYKDDAIVNAGKMAEGARQVQIFAPAECHRPNCSVSYSYAEFGTIKDWAAAASHRTRCNISPF